MKKRDFRPSPAMIVACVALFVAVGGTTYAATGGNLILGKANSASNPTSLSAPVAGKALQFTNTKTTAGATALGLSVAPGHSPFTVNSGTKVANLNADKLDGLDSSAFLPSSDVKSWVFNPGHGCQNASDAGCSATFSLGGLSLTASCDVINMGSTTNFELDNTSATTKVGSEYISGNSATQSVAPASSPILSLQQSVVASGSTDAQGTLINLANAKPETANFMATVSHDGSFNAECQLWFVGNRPPV